ncbi:hypothetical protein HYQ46_007629 [Verticillium longisporum]|nr:hypothetical protein HYQ46_007629 [Verticillium longisporum]
MSRERAFSGTAVFLKRDLTGVADVALGGAVGALEAGALSQAVEAFLTDDVAAGEKHRRVLLRALFFGDGTDEDGVVDHGPGERRLESELVLGRPLGAAGHDVVCVLE